MSFGTYVILRNNIPICANIQWAYCSNNTGYNSIQKVAYTQGGPKT